MNATALRASADAHLSEVYARLESASRAYYLATDRFGPCSDETVPARNRLRSAWMAMESAKIAAASTSRIGVKS